MRSAEICSIYSIIREYQKKGEEAVNQENDDTIHWISIFLKDYADADIYEDASSIYESSEMLKKKEKKAAEKARLLVQERFEFSCLAPYELYENECSDLEIALFSWSVGFEKMIYDLERFRISGLFRRQIEDLINGYSYLYRRTKNGCFRFLMQGLLIKKI